MHPNKITGKDIVLYMLPHKLKWYQKILQKLHIKNYYQRVGTNTEKLKWEVINNDFR